MTTALLCIALLGLLVFVLGMFVSLNRGRTQKVIGFDPSPTDPLHKAVRAHGNSTEYAPMLAVLMAVLGALEPAAWLSWVMIAAVVSRYMIAGGLLRGSLDSPNPVRALGALGTYVTGLLLCVGVFVSM